MQPETASLPCSAICLANLRCEGSRRADSSHQNANDIGAAQRRRAAWPVLGGGASTSHAMLLDPGHGPINELPLPKESRRCLADKGGCQLICGFIGSPKRREIVGL